METFDELKKWVDALSVAEKRFIKLQGKARAGNSSSQQLKLFDWLNKPGPLAALPPGPALQNVHTVANRLRDLVLDSLRILHKEDSSEAVLHTLLEELAILYQKKLYRAASRHLKRAKKLAQETCRYGILLQCIDWERKVMKMLFPNEFMNLLRQLRKEETAILEKQSALLDLRHRHEQLVGLVRENSFRQSAVVSEEIAALSPEAEISFFISSGTYLEQALAVNIQGIRDLYERKTLPALERYEKLLRQWQKHPAWQAEQTPLLVLISKFYQSACFYAPLSWKEAKGYLKILNGFSGLAPDAKRDFQRILYHNQFTLALNMGKFDSVKSLIPEIDAWIENEAKHLSEAQVLPFLCNFSIAEFLYGNMESANRFVNRIHGMPNRKVRVDIREFALVLQAVVQYELGNESLNEYLTRSGKRHFSSSKYEINFERAVFDHLDVLLRKGTVKETQASLYKLIRELDELAKQVEGSVSFLGLNEIRMWAQAKQKKISLREIFLQEVQKQLTDAEAGLPL